LYTVFKRLLRVSRLKNQDRIHVFSVGGGNLEKQVSPNLVTALQYAQSVGAAIMGIDGRDGRYAASAADPCIIIPTVNDSHITPHAEAFQAVVSHLLVSHPWLNLEQTCWNCI